MKWPTVVVRLFGVVILFPCLFVAFVFLIFLDKETAYDIARLPFFLMTYKME